MALFKNSVQIAGIRSLAEALLLEELGVDFLGFPLRLGYHTPDISEAQAKSIIKMLKYPERAVLITYLQTAREIEALVRYLGVGIIQLHGDVVVEEIWRLKEMVPELLISKSLIVRPECSDLKHPLFEQAQAFEQAVHGFFTDTFDPKTGATGCTGLTHDWAVSRKLGLTLKKPLVLAGGLRPSNVFDAILAVEPSGVDAHSCVEAAEGSKSPDLVEKFLTEARRGFVFLEAHSSGIAQSPL